MSSLAASTPQPYRLLFVCDPDDEPEKAAVDAAGGERLDVAGNYAAKINAGYRATTEPLLFLGADDVVFHPNWLERAMAHLGPGIGVVGTQDMGNPRVLAGVHATHLLVTRAYVDEFGTIDEPGKVLHEGYQHNFVDTELVETAKARGAWAFARDSVVEHLHPHWSKAEDDDTYRKGQAGFAIDQRLHRRREHLWT